MALMLHSAVLSSSPGVSHGFFTRKGGVSEGVHGTLNCGPGSDDDPAKVDENRRRALAALDAQPDSLLTLYQIHSADVVTVDAVWDSGQRPKADAMVTDRPGLVLGILTADCAPVLFADSQAGVVGAAHAGWKGALGGVVPATVSAMERIGADRTRIVAAIGPCISQASYEVSAEFRDPFIAQSADNGRFFSAGERDGHLQFDLEGYVAHSLKRCGVSRFEALHEDTRMQDDLFFSYRRTCLRRERDYGRQLSAIGLMTAHNSA